MKFLTPGFYLTKAKTTLFSTLKLILLLFIMILLSLLLTFICSFIIKVPSEMEKNIAFHLDNGNLISEVHSDCLFNTEINSNKQCVDILNKIYSIHIEIDLHKSKLLPNLFESKLEFFSEKNTDKNFSLKKVTFLKDENKFLQFINDFTLIIPRFFGYFQTEKITVKFIDDFDNSIFHLNKVRLSLETNTLGIDKAVIYFIPNLSFVQYFIGKMYYITLFFVLAGSLISQLLLYFVFTLYNCFYSNGKKDKDD